MPLTEAKWVDLQNNLNNQNLSIHQMDVRDPAAIEELSNSIDGEIDLLINNAGVADGRWQSISEIDMQHALDVIEINSIEISPCSRNSKTAQPNE